MLMFMAVDPVLPSEVDLFEVMRPRLFGLAHRMLGEAVAAEDVVARADGGGTVSAARRPILGRDTRCPAGLLKNPPSVLH